MKQRIRGVLLSMWAVGVIVLGVGVAPTRGEGADLQELLRLYAAQDYEGLGLALGLEEVTPVVRRGLSSVRLDVREGRYYIQLSLRTTLQLSHALSQSLRANRLRLVQDRSRLASARLKFRPQLSTSAAQTRSLTYGGSTSATGAAATGFSELVTRTDATTLSAEWVKPTSTGIRYGLSYSESLASTQLLRVSESDVQNAGGGSSPLSIGTLDAVVQVPIGRDYGRRVNALSIERAAIDLTDTAHGVRGVELAVLAQLARIYWQMFGAQQTLAVAETATQLAAQLLEDNTERLEAGVLEPSELQATETQLAAEEANRLGAELDVVRVSDQLRVLVGFTGLPESVRFEAVDEPQVRQKLPLEAEALRRAFAQDAQLQQLLAQQGRTRIDVLDAQNRLAPDLDLRVSYQLNGYGENSLTAPGRFGESQLHGHGVVFTWTKSLSDPRVDQELERYRLQDTRWQLEINGRRDTLIIALKTTYRQLQLAERQIDAANQARRLAQTELRNGIERQRLGKATAYEVSRLQQNLRSADSRYILAQVNYELIHLDLLEWSGDFFKQYDLQPPAQEGDHS